MSTINTGNGLEKSNSFEMSYFDRDDPRSLFNIAPGSFRELIQTNTHLPNLTKMSEKDLQKMAKPTPIVSRLRLAFWKEYERAQHLKTDMNFENCYKGVCTREYFYELIENQKNLCSIAWIIRPPSNYVVAMEEALHHGIERMREILDYPLWDTKIVTNAKGIRREKKIPNTKVAELILKTVQLLDTRVKGAVVQRVKHNVKVEQEQTKPTNIVEADVASPEAREHYMEQRIRELEMELDSNRGVFKDAYDSASKPEENEDSDYVPYKEIDDE